MSVDVSRPCSLLECAAAFKDQQRGPEIKAECLGLGLPKRGAHWVRQMAETGPVYPGLTATQPFLPKRARRPASEGWRGGECSNRRTYSIIKQSFNLDGRGWFLYAITGGTCGLKVTSQSSAGFSWPSPTCAVQHRTKAQGRVGAWCNIQQQMNEPVCHRRCLCVTEGTAVSMAVTSWQRRVHGDEGRVQHGFSWSLLPLTDRGRRERGGCAFIS